MNETPLPPLYDDMDIVRWWNKYICGFGGASAPTRPQEISLPSTRPHTRHEVLDRLRNFSGAEKVYIQESGPCPSTGVSLGVCRETFIKDIDGGTLLIADLVSRFYRSFATAYAIYRITTREEFLKDTAARDSLNTCIRCMSIIIAIEASREDSGKRREWLDKDITAFVIDYVFCK